MLVEYVILENASWPFHFVPGPIQSNYVDCGIYVLATAIYLLAGVELPR